MTLQELYKNKRIYQDNVYEDNQAAWAAGAITVRMNHDEDDKIKYSCSRPWMKVLAELLRL